MKLRKLLTYVFSLLLLSFTMVSYADSDYQISLNHNFDTPIEIEFLLSDYEVTNVFEDHQSFSKILFEGGVNLGKKGFAEVPFLHAAVQLPAQGNYSIEVLDSSYDDYHLDAPLIPSKGTIFRNQNPASIAYAIEPDSVTNQWYPESIAKMSEPFILRDIRGVNVYAYPFQYNAEEMILRVYKQVVVRVIPNASPTINEQTSKTLGSGNIAAEMQSIYSDLFINYSTPKTKADIEEMGDILVIHTSRDAGAIQPYVDWKRQKGFNVTTEQVSTGTNVKSIIQDAYNTNNNLLYVQLVGDWADIKSDIGSSGSAPMDPMLGCVTGNDNYPDVIIGRFSANSTSHVTTQVDKTINYEKNPDLSGSWYANGLGIASDEGAGSGDDGEADFEHMDIIKENKLIPYTYTNVEEVYKSGSASTVSGYVNNGLSVINYTGHGSDDSWVTSGFSNSNINSLSNGNKLPVIFSVACVNGTFHKSSDCFAETWLRKDNGGAVASLMATINQPWQPPMRGQDYMNDLMTGGYNYNNNPGNGTSTTEGRTTFGSIVFNALLLMYAESAQSSDLDTIQTWTIFGDSALQVRTKSPDSISVSNQTVSSGETFKTQVTRDSGQSVAGAMVALQQDGNVISGLTGSNGEVSLNHSFTSGTVTLVVSGSNLDTLFLDVTIGGGTNPGNYCESNSKSQKYEYIGQVAVGTFSNSSDASPYSDFTSKIIEMTVNTEYSVELTPKYTGSVYTEYWTIWIDLNKDGDFEDSGEVLLQNFGNSNVSGSITIPEGTSSGNTRMRVSMKYNNYPASCESLSYGEVEDYSVSIN